MGAWRLWGAALALVLVAAPAIAADREPPAEGGAQPLARDHVLETRKLLEEVLMARLTRDLALDEEQAGLLARHLAAYRETISALRQERMQLMRALRQAVRESKDEERIASLLVQADELDDRTVNARKAVVEIPELDLTAWQKARLFLFLHDFEGDMRRLIKRAQERREAVIERQKRGPAGESLPDPAPGGKPSAGESPPESSAASGANAAK